MDMLMLVIRNWKMAFSFNVLYLNYLCLYSYGVHYFKMESFKNFISTSTFRRSWSIFISILVIVLFASAFFWSSLFRFLTGSSSLFIFSSTSWSIKIRKRGKKWLVGSGSWIGRRGKGSYLKFFWWYLIETLTLRSARIMSYINSNIAIINSNLTYESFYAIITIYVIATLINDSSISSNFI